MNIEQSWLVAFSTISVLAGYKVALAAASGARSADLRIS